MQGPLLKIQQTHEQTEIGEGKECAYGYYLRDVKPDMPNIAFFHLRFTTESNSVHWRAFSESPNKTANVEAADTWKRDRSSCPSTWLLESLGMTALVLLAQGKGGECLKNINPIFKSHLRCRVFLPWCCAYPKPRWLRHANCEAQYFIWNIWNLVSSTWLLCDSWQRVWNECPWGTCWSHWIYCIVTFGYWAGMSHQTPSQA